MKEYNQEELMKKIDSLINDEIVKSVSRNDGDNHYFFIKGVFKSRDKLLNLIDYRIKGRHLNKQNNPITNEEAVGIHSTLLNNIPSSDTNNKFYVSGYKYVFSLYTDIINIHARSIMKYYIKSPSESEKELSEDSYKKLKHLVDEIHRKERVYVMNDIEFFTKRVAISEEDYNEREN